MEATADRAEKGLSAPEQIGLSLVELPIALGVAFAGFVAIDTLGCSIKSCDDLSTAYLSAIAALLVGVALGIAYWLRAFTLKSRRRPRLALDAVAVAAVLVAYQLPLFLSQQKAARSNAASAAATERYRIQYARERAVWIESLKGRDAHGPAGQVPPTLRVVDDGRAGLTVTNAGPKAHDVALARVIEDPQAPGGWRGCALYWAGDQNHFDLHWLSPGKTEHFQPDARCADEFLDAPVEYRVGDGPPDGDGWWSDSAFAAPEGRSRPGPVFAPTIRRGTQVTAEPRSSDRAASSR